MPNTAQDDEYEGGGEYLQPINNNASREELLEALKASQLYVMKLLSENRTLRKENNELKATRSKKSCKDTGEQDLLGYRPHIVTLAKKFLFLCALVIDTTLFRTNPPFPDNQFADETAYRQSITNALYRDIPEKFHPALDGQTYTSFAKEFVHEHGEGRSTLISIIRKNLPTILKGLGIDSDILTTAGADRSNNAALTCLLCFPNQRKATLYAPVLFPGATQNMNELFTGPIVMKVHRLMYFGPKSLVPGNKPAANSNGIKMGLIEVTESSISAAGTLARFVLSTDKAWASVGAISGTDWEADYRAYHKLLATNRHLPHVQKIFKKIHKFVFESVNTSTEATSQEDLDDDAEDAIADAMRRFELGTDPASDPEDGAADVPGGSGVAAVVSVEFAPVAATRIAEESPHEPEVEAAPNQALAATRRQRTARNSASAGASSTSGVGPRTRARR
ncbi:hypothetical protein B0H17DRAFT_1196694 [Mycena rosella]|uniref:Uncharacterized protein n=1 Tax=Mycena rosella TaxID=1033263 RepID=A0AAD7DTD7_MYCRO|nr:hypothetical protein B0H17DRAFT_1196694 [Mycena rosella]